MKLTLKDTSTKKFGVITQVLINKKSVPEYFRSIMREQKEFISLCGSSVNYRYYTRLDIEETEKLIIAVKNRLNEIQSAENYIKKISKVIDGYINDKSIPIEYRECFSENINKMVSDIKIKNV